MLMMLLMLRYGEKRLEIRDGDDSTLVASLTGNSKGQVLRLTSNFNMTSLTSMNIEGRTFI
jgi:hypothetical protein